MLTSNADKVLRFMFPDSKDGTWALSDMSDGSGIFISAWNRAEPMPTEEEINRNEQAMLDNEKRVIASTITQADRDSAMIAVLTEKIAVLEKLAGIKETTVEDIEAKQDAKIESIISDRLADAVVVP